MANDMLILESIFGHLVFILLVVPGTEDITPV